MSEIKLILTKLKIVSEEKENGMYLCDRKHSKILLDYIQQKENIIKEVREYIENNSQYDDNVDNYWTTTNELLEILDKENK